MFADQKALFMEQIENLEALKTGLMNKINHAWGAYEHLEVDTFYPEMEMYSRYIIDTILADYKRMVAEKNTIDDRIKTYWKAVEVLANSEE